MDQDGLLLEEARALKAARKEAGIENLLAGLAGIVIRVQENRLNDSIRELVSTTALEHVQSFSHGGFSQALLQAERTPAFIVRENKEPSPIRHLNTRPRTESAPDTRLETFIFEAPDIKELVDIQRGRGVSFTSEIREIGDNLFIRTRPSPNTHNSVGYVQFLGDKSFCPEKAAFKHIPKPENDFIGKIGFLDHAATRITHSDRIPAILEWMNLTGYDFSESVYAERFNSITNVTRLRGRDFAMVLTSGIGPSAGDRPDPTEKFVRNYGKRVHHLAWQADPIADVFEGLKCGGTGFLLDLVGGKDEGLMQTFTVPSKNTFLVQEYIHRYGDFDGFFTKDNVTKLTAATDAQ